MFSTLKGGAVRSPSPAAIAMAGAAREQTCRCKECPPSPTPRRSIRSPPAWIPTWPEPRLVVLTDIANEPDDQMSIVRFLVYANQFDIEGLARRRPPGCRSRARPDVIRSVIDAYAKVQPNLATHAPAFRRPTRCARWSTPDSPATAWPRSARDKMTPGAERLSGRRTRPIRGRSGFSSGAARTHSPRRFWHVRDDAAGRGARDASSRSCASTRFRPGRRRALDPPGVPDPALHRHPVDATTATVLPRHVDRHQRRPVLPQRRWRRLHHYSRRVGQRPHPKQGAARRALPPPVLHPRGDTPSFLGLINNGLASSMSPTFGGWGGRYVWRHVGETRPFWTQGGDSIRAATARATPWSAPTASATRPTRPRSGDGAAFQHDFAARMDWTITDVAHANHNPHVVVNGVTARRR